MSTTKLRIDLSQGIIEAEGTEEFVSSIYSDFKDKLVVTAPDIRKRQSVPTPASPAKRSTSKAKAKVVSKTKNSTPKPFTTPTLLKDLDLSGGSNESLQDFYSKYEVV